MGLSEMSWKVLFRFACHGCVLIIINVMHDIADIRAKNDSEKKLNKEIAVPLNCLVEILK